MLISSEALRQLGIAALIVTAAAILGQIAMLLAQAVRFQQQEEKAG